MKKLSIILRASLITFGLASLVGCGQKGPLILEEVPEDKTQQPLENTPDEVPVVTDEAVEEETE